MATCEVENVSRGNVTVETVSSETYEKLLKYTEGTCNFLIKRIRKSAWTLSTAELTTKYADRIRYLLAEVIPTSLANEATNKLLSHMDEKFNHDRVTKMTLSQRLMLSEIEGSVILPEASIIEPYPDKFVCSSPFATRKFNTNFTVSVICQRIADLKRLEVLNIGCYRYNHQWQTDITGLPTNLKEFCGVCNDRELNLLSSRCPNLTHLSLLNSEGLTEASVSYIISFRHLQSLVIRNSILTLHATKILLNGLTKLTSFKRLTYKYLTVTTLDDFRKNVLKVSNDFKQMKIWYTNCSLLSQFEGLEGICVLTNLQILSGVMVDIGARLVYLNIKICCTEVHMQDLVVIGNNCPLLQCFRLEAFFENFVPDLQPTTSGFESVQCLGIDFSPVYSDNEKVEDQQVLAEYLISRCINVVKLSVGHFYYCSKYKLMENVFRMNSLERLQELYWKYQCSGCDDNQVARLLAERCPNFKIGSGFSGIKDVDAYGSIKFIRHLSVINMHSDHCRIQRI